MTDLTIERLGHLGDGIASGPVFVPLTLPGERVAGEIDGDRMPSPRIVTPSPQRVSPPCGHFKTCGGCALQHASDGFVADWKAEVVCTALAAQGLDAPIRGVHTSPPASRRRATLSGRRTKKGALVGFHARASDVIVDIPGCTLLLPQIVALRPVLEGLTILGGSRKAELGFAITWSDLGADIAVWGGKPLDGPLRAALAVEVGKHGLARLTWDGEWIAERAPPVQSMDGIAVVPPPGAFLQATVEGEDALRRAVEEAVGPARRIVDLFAGCGTFALPLSRGAEVLAVEGDAALLAALETAWRKAQGLRTIRQEKRDLFRRPLLPDELAGYDAVVIDPPRAGAEAQMDQIAASDVPVVAAVSCNPVTFARDARRLVSAGYRIDWIDVVDQFRWSPHVELVARITRV
ncbi:class I SAM-dependent RNA methyltransferase [Anianabacter salinae]|uniref:class I SAM-dependent RNA methyltransferase n=1 Tax=Anianabacter salinae TaxID=2851023 RepID=UPI00225E53BB|nr:RsmD family RNA methyltransferase [Anianabacter salinae]MBV0913543.1 RsmD family RNA methyltransferase [Anianabacter salinae]